MKLSANFDTNEFACGCRCGFGLHPDDIDPLLWQSLQTLRDDLCGAIYLTSGCRCAAHNEAVGGAPDNQHLLGKAADVYGFPLHLIVEAATRIEAFANGGMGLYPIKNFVHLDVRGMAARWTG